MAQDYHYQHDDSPFTADSTSLPRTPVSPLLPALNTTNLDRNGHDLNHQLVSPIMSRSPSIASISQFSALSGGTGAFPANPANVRPQAAYVAPFGAAQVVSDHQASHAGGLPSDDEDEHKISKDDVSFSPSALALINAFLDQLLFSFLSTAKSTTLSALRPAVTEILRHKLARDAIASANEELSDLLAGGDDEDEKEPENVDGTKWDLELVWRRTRLRVMVYMRLGEMEDDDEERHVKEQELFANGDRSRFSSTAGLVSWSAAIFLTSVLEHVAEQTLQVAGTAAFARLRQHHNTGERVGFESVYLWKNKMRSALLSIRPWAGYGAHGEVIAASPAKSVSTFRDSFGTAPESVHEDPDEDREPPDTRYPEHVLASNIRLPIGDPLRDVDEIEVPGLARDPSETASQRTATPIASRPDRRRSFSHYQSQQAEAKALAGPTGLPDEDDAMRPVLQRKRSTSVPAPYRNVSEAFVTPEATSGEEVVTKKALASEQVTQGPVYGPVELKDFDFTMNDEVDKRKSLIDIKTLLAAINGGQAAFTASKDLPKEDRPASADSNQSFSLGNKENGGVVPQQPVAERQHMAHGDDETAQIGVATTSDQAVAPERTPSAAGTRGVSPSPMHANNISRASSVARSRYSPNLPEDAQQLQDQAPATDAAPARDRPIEPNALTLAALRESVQRASSPQAAQQEAVDQSSQANRKSTALQYPISAFNSTAQSGQAIDHPVLQQKKALEPRKDPNQVTSASIRGPEDFEQFVRSDEVHKYTLTPEPIRDAPMTNEQSLAQLTGEVPEVVQSANASDKADSRSVRRSQLGKSFYSATGEELTDAERKKKRWSITKPPSRNSSVLRRSGLMAREARVITESTRDFADFIRSTKPSVEPTVQPLPAAQNYRNSTNYSLPRTQSLTSERTKSLTKGDIAAGYAPPVPSIPDKSRASLQPKPASGGSQQNGELIAFIRDGPKQDGQSRISRSIAPFRSTMDSDQFDALRSSPPDAKDTRNRASVVPNGISNAGSIAHPAYSGQQQSINAATTESKDPQRKQYRNKDPYAIDDEDDDISALPKGKRGDTLAEFLRGEESGESKPIASAASLAQAREIMERARAQRTSSYGPSDGTEVTALPTSKAPTAASRPNTSSQTGKPAQSNTSDLADFLRNSEPPAAAPAPSVGRGVQAQKSIQQKENNVPKEKKRGFFSFFSRKSSSKGKPTRHSDMP
ncbi:hypothetical protein AMS68_001299 [Peltaster fructicola]|uniref:Uncharacterized protein n=1 Tax=Peltaster fructicola TaxID=286661 RepID=A0A6H0XM03_9PEZI|nr:hypothetical protein AMS68_001299 [Peltaster fructicola]